MRKLIGPIAFAIGLSGCAALPGIIDTLFGQARGQATRTPLYVYRADLFLKVNNQAFDGVGVTELSDRVNIEVTSQINLDRVEIETCSRQDVCQNGKPCPATFKIDTDWFGKPGKKLYYAYLPTELEKGPSCPIYIRVFDKRALAAWGFLAFRNNEDLVGHMLCNGEKKDSVGHSVCQVKAGLIQTFKTDVPVEEFSADIECGLKKIDDKTFEIRPILGKCVAKFYSQTHWHELNLIAYDEVLIRGN